MKRIALSIGLATLMVAGPFAARADTPENPDAPRALKAGETFTAPTDGAFVTDAKSTAMLNAFKRVTEERDGFKAKLEAKPADTPAKSLIIAGTVAAVVGFVAGIVTTAYVVQHALK